jgi:peptidoglycan/xylan/chitin deacetylase (PgdA/CDA1 family)
MPARQVDFVMRNNGKNRKKSARSYKIFITFVLLLLGVPVIWKNDRCAQQTDRETSIFAQTEMETVQASDASGDCMEDTKQKKVALTFDDGPHPTYTKELLDGLKKRGVKATFFVVGEQVESCPKIIRRMYRQGHLIGNHTYHHVQLNVMSEEQACSEVLDTNAAIREITGEEPMYLRPPYGEWEKTLEGTVNMIPVLWDVDSLDWTTDNVDEIVQRVLNEVEDGDVILMHDYYESSVRAALTIVDALQTQGYEFVTVNELIVQ